MMLNLFKRDVIHKGREMKTVLRCPPVHVPCIPRHLKKERRNIQDYAIDYGSPVCIVLSPRLPQHHLYALFLSIYLHHRRASAGLHSLAWSDWIERDVWWFGEGIQLHKKLFLVKTVRQALLLIRQNVDCGLKSLSELVSGFCDTLETAFWGFYWYQGPRCGLLWIRIICECKTKAPGQQRNTFLWERNTWYVYHRVPSHLVVGLVVHMTRWLWWGVHGLVWSFGRGSDNQLENLNWFKCRFVFVVFFFLNALA